MWRSLQKKLIIDQLEIHIIPKITSPIRLQEYGVGIFSSVRTKSALKKVIKKGLVKVNDKTATTATIIKGGEHISLYVEEKKSSDKKLIFPLKVLYEDEYLAVIHKPAGVLVSGNSFITIANALSQNLKPSTLADATKPQPVHRLDFATTGVLLVGKTSSSIRSLNKLFEDNKVDKNYYAITIGRMQLQEDEITLDIDSKNSKSNYRVIESVDSIRFDKLNLVLLQPQTGRRHQLRKHLSSIGNPILGDKEYGFEKLILNGKGLYLHAYSISFIHPYTQNRVCVKDELPEKFTKIIKLRF